MYVRGKSVREQFADEWARGIAFAEKQGASAGAIRALRAYASADVNDTVAVLNETVFENPVRGANAFRAWLQWYPDYVLREVSRLLPELSVEFPGDRARRVRQSQRRQLDRWCSDGEDVLAHAFRPIDGELVRRKLRLQRDRFAKLCGALVNVGALNVWADGRLYQTAAGSYVQAALRARWLGEGSDQPDWIDPLPEGCRWEPNAGPTSDG